MANPTGTDGPNPILLAAEDERGPEYGDAVRRTAAAFARARAALGPVRRKLDVVGDLAPVALSLPPDTPLIIGVSQIVAPRSSPSEWVSVIVPQIVPTLALPEARVRDSNGREYDTLRPALHLSEWHIPDGDTDAAPPQAFHLYDRLLETLDHDGPADILHAGGAALTSIAELLGDEHDGPTAHLAEDGPLASLIVVAVARIYELAAFLSVLGTQAQAAEDTAAQRAAADRAAEAGAGDQEAAAGAAPGDQEGL